MYGGPIIDPHHHLWDLSMGRHPWLTSRAEGALGMFSPIARSYGVDDYRRDAAGQNIVATVHIEALWSGEPVEETRWLDTLDKTDGIALRYVANARLGTPEAARMIDEQADAPRVVGVRSILSWHPDPARSFVEDPRLSYRPGWRRDVGLLRDRGLHLELMMYPHQVEPVTDLARAFPDLLIVINHEGSPIDRDDDGMARWRNAVRQLSALPNIVLKISHPGAYDPAWTAESIRDAIRHCLDCFGLDRAMLGSDAPVSRLVQAFPDLYASLRAAVADLSQDEQRKLFFDNARRTYRLDGAALLTEGRVLAP